MGRHSSHSQFAYYRSVVGWALPWFLIAAVFAIVVWFAVDALGGDTAEKPPKVASAAESPSPDESETPAPKKSPSPSPKEKPKDDSPFEPDSETDPDVKLVTEGVTIQVLNGTASSLAGTDMSNELTDLGFQVVVVNDASKPYAATTVFWSTSTSQEAAEALAARFGWVAEEKPANLTDSVSLHVVVGEDYL